MDRNIQISKIGDDVLVENKSENIDNEKSGNKSKFEIIGKGLFIRLILLAIIPLFLMGAGVSFVSGAKFINEMRDENYEQMQAVDNMLLRTYMKINNKDYIYKDGNIYKGEYGITTDIDLINSVKTDTGADISIFHGGDILATTIEDNPKKLDERDAETSVIKDKVLNEGLSYMTTAVMDGVEYYTCFVPIIDKNENNIGMIAASKPKTAVRNAMFENVRGILVVLLVMLGASIVIIFFFTKAIIKRIKKVSSYLGSMREGDLTVQMSESSLNDSTEIGDMAESAVKLNNSLNKMVDNIKNTGEHLKKSADNMKKTAEFTNNTTEDINKAIEGIAAGASSQAEETQNATNSVMDMGENIEKISDVVSSLLENADVMSRSGEDAHKLMTELSDANIETINAVQKVYHHTELTNDAVKKINRAATVITSIAEETNLLALNASIEAARAGENGRGFAVVAQEIQKLAEQSNESADEIVKEIENLIKQSELSVEVMEEVKENVDKKSDKLTDTFGKFEVVVRGIRKSVDNINEIGNLMEDLNEGRKSIIDVIQSLSAVSEENAAASQETYASTMQFSEVINKLVEDANELNVLSEKLAENISIFKTK
ncbi:MAG: cache domain-containing protein [Lachnospiraceae bacterium]|nr:cache domain-containing protein [Lachnospiraceae bacterium]